MTRYDATPKCAHTIVDRPKHARLSAEPATKAYELRTRARTPASLTLATSSATPKIGKPSAIAGARASPKRNSVAPRGWPDASDAARTTSSHDDAIDAISARIARTARR